MAPLAIKYYNTSRMKIAIFSDTYYPQINGVVTSTRILFRELERLGHTVLIIGPRMEGSHRSTHKVWRFRSAPFPFQKEYRLISPVSRQLTKFKDMNFDLVHIQTPFSLGHLAQYLSWKHDIPMVHTYHTFWAEYAHYLPFVPKKFVNKMDNLLFSKNFCNRCQHIIAPSGQMKDKLDEYGITTPITIIPTGIELDKIQAIDGSTFRDEYKIKNNAPMLIFVGRCGLEKNVFFLLESFKEILKKKSNAVLFIAGDGPERINMEAYVKEFGMDKNVIFAGYISHEDIFRAYSEADVIMFPSKTETQGLSLLEGLAMGKPAVCINEMGVTSILENNIGGFLTEEDIGKYSQKVLELLDNKQLHKTKQQEALSRANTFSSRSMVDKILQVYEQAIQDKKNSPTKKQSIDKFFSESILNKFLKG
jgi:1,2-diacylglycerol 3-alpha-glucosyltransferase